MRLHRFYINIPIELAEPFDSADEAISATPISITNESLVHQWKKVFRLVSGDKVIVFDGSGFDYVVEIEFEGKDTAKLVVIETWENKSGMDSDMNSEAGTGVTLYAAIVKKDNFEWIAEKATELGVSRIVPVISERSEKKNLNIERLQRILIEASEQSGRGNVPELAEIVSLEEVIEQIKIVGEKKDFEVVNSIAWDPTGKMYSEAEIKNKPVNIFVGPEGGWTENELAKFEMAGIAIRSLGTQVLRAETAVIAVLAKVIL